MYIFTYTSVYPSATLFAMKDVGLRIRVQRELREQFLAVCREQDKPAAQVLREFMREYVALHEPGQDDADMVRRETSKLVPGKGR